MLKKIFIVAEIGINHNGDLEIAKKLIKKSKEIGIDAVKFQKRTIDKVYSSELLNSFRESPWGKTQRDQKEGLEFGQKEYDEIDSFCKNLDIQWYASCWDIESQKFIRQYNCSYNKVASAMLNHSELIDEIISEKKHTFISTGMHTIEEIEKVVNKFREKNCPFELMHTVSTYPMKDEDANLLMINTLKEKFNCDVGYSGHEVGRAVTVAAAAIGATSIERHITLDRAMYGSDQSASMQVDGFELLVKYIRIVEKAMGNGKKIILDEEKLIREKLKPLL